MWGQEVRPCVGSDPELWFGPADDVVPELRETRSERAAREDVAKQVCAECPLSARCLEQELWFGIVEQWGVRGGLTASERQHLLRRRHAADLRVVTIDAAVA
jgi:WhiB family transcriptional regulator, redox-sensing transcriptional regulator